MPRLPKVDNAAALSKTVQVKEGTTSSPIIILQIANAADEAPPWWSIYRDRYLDKFWPTEPYLAGAVYSITARNSSFRWQLSGSDRDVWWAHNLLINADFGQGWQPFISKITLDYLTQGNAAFFEVIRPAKAKMTSTDDFLDAICMPNASGDPQWIPFDSKSGEVFYDAVADYDFKITDFPLDLPIGLAHLDSQRCTRTGDPQFPVIYTDAKGAQHKLNWYQCITLEEMPSPREEMKGVQHSAVDRALRLSQILRDMLIYKQEKISGRFARAVHITNADAQLLQDAIDQAYQNADDRGLMRYIQPIILSTVDPEADPAVATIPLATLPDGFNEEDTMRWYIAGLANAFGVDYGFLAPLPGNKLGTSTQAETQERQARGKSSRLFMQSITYKLNNSGILPRTVEFSFTMSDPWEESEQDRALARRARAYQTFIQSGLLPIEIVRQIAADKGDIDPKYLELLGEVDMTPEITVSGTDARTFTRHREPKISPQQLSLFQQEPQQPQRPGQGGGNAQ